MTTANNLSIEIPETRIVKHGLTLSRINIIKEHSSKLSVAGVKDHEGLKKVTKTRKFIKKLRLGVEIKRKHLNADMLREMRENNFAARFIINELKPSEKYLGNIEKQIANEKEAIRLEKKRIALEKLQKRIDALAPYNVAVDIASIKDLTDEQFTNLLDKVKFDHAAEESRKQMQANLLADQNKALLEENIKLKNTVAAIANVPEAELIIENPLPNREPFPVSQVGSATSTETKTDPSSEDTSEIKLAVKNYALALQAVPLPSIKNEQARAVFLSAHAHIQMGINMLLKAVE